MCNYEERNDDVFEWEEEAALHPAPVPYLEHLSPLPYRTKLTIAELLEIQKFLFTISAYHSRIEDKIL